MAKLMARTKAVLAHNTAALAQVQQHLGLPPIPLTPAAAAIGSQALPLAAPMVIPVVVAADLALVPLAAHPSAHAQSQDEDEVPPSTTT